MNFLRSKRASTEVGRRRPVHADEAASPSETDGPLQPTKREGNKDITKDMPPDKQLEEKVLLKCCEYLAENLPADDVAPRMLSSHLLTSKEHDEYRALKRSYRSMTDLSYYLLECLRKRQAGFLGKFCAILWEIEPAKYLGDHIQEAYNATVSQEGFNPGSRDRLSKLSYSDTDITTKAVSQGAINPPCVMCKMLKKQNRQLKEQLTELDRENQLLYNAKIKIETQLETLQDQLQKEERDRQNLASMFIVPKLQEVITLIESHNRAVEPSGTQQTLKRMNDLINEQTRHDVSRRKFRNSFGFSMLSLFSDTSSIVDIAGEEETGRQNGIANVPGTTPATQYGADSLNKSAPVNNTKNGKPMTMPAMDMVRGRECTETHAVPSPEADREHLKATPFRSQDAKEIPHKPIRCDSTPASDWNKSHSAPVRKPRHHSVSGATENSTKNVLHEDLSQSFKTGERRRKLTYPPGPVQGSQSYLQSNELQSKLEQQRKRIESSYNVLEKD